MANEKSLISKNVLYAGEGDIPEFEHGSKVHLVLRKSYVRMKFCSILVMQKKKKKKMMHTVFPLSGYISFQDIQS